MATNSTSKLKLTIVGVASVAVLCLLAPAAMKRIMPASKAASVATQPAPIPATTVKVAQEDVPIYLNGVGNAQALATVTIHSRVDGQLDRVNFVEGQDVKAGQVLAQLDARTFAAQLDQAVAQKARDQAQLDNAKLDLQRDATLIKDDATTQQALDTQQALVNQLVAAVATDTAQINYAKVQLDFTTITAPLSGRIGARLVDPGNIVHATDTNGLVVINQVDPISVIFTLPESSFQDINNAQRTGEQLPVLAFARDSNKVLSTGSLIMLNNQIDTTTGTVQLKAHFPNPNHTLWPGQYLNVSLQLGTRHHALTVPAAVIQRSQTGTYVFVVDADNRANVRPVDVLQIQDGKAVIGKGLSLNERVVLDGQYKLKPGLRIAEASAASSSTSTQAPGSVK